MAKIKTDSDKFSEAIKRNIDKLNNAIDVLFNKAGLTMVETTRKLQDVNNNYATRRLSNLTSYKIEKQTLTFGSNAKSRGKYYGLEQEFGRKPGKYPNIDDLKKWVKIKARLGHIRLDQELGKNKQQRIDALAFLVARAIKRKGIKGKFFYRQGFLEGNKYFFENVNNIIKKAFNQ